MIRMDYFAHPPGDGVVEPERPDSEYFGTETRAAGRSSSPIIRPGIVDREAPPKPEGRASSESPDQKPTTSKLLTLSGWVTTESGQPVAGEKLVLYSPSKKLRYATNTGSSGEYRFIDIEPGWDYVLNISPREIFETYTRAQIKLSSEQEVHDITLQPIPLGILTGNIVDPYARPVAGIELRVTTVEKEYQTTRVVTDANGGFSVADFPRGKYQLAIKGEQTLKATGLKFDPETGSPVTLTLDLGPYRIEGGIYDESGQTFDGADVYLIWALHENGVSIRSTRKFSADRSGTFRFAGLGPGRHELVVSAWRGGKVKKAVKQTVDVGIDSGELLVVIKTF